MNDNNNPANPTTRTSPGLTEQADPLDAPTPQEENEGRIVRVEANFLRLPMFALDTTQMRRMDGIRCDGSFSRGRQRYAFTFAATRNARSLYPGPVARAAHLAILSLATDRGLPVQNPIVFTWRELLERMELARSGRTVREVKEALMATKGLMIESTHALYSKPAAAMFSTGPGLNKVVGLYEELEFFGSQRADLTVADINAVRLSKWYLDNLNALYCSPVNYDLWRALARKSPMASRLYEFLLPKFYGAGAGAVLKFNYPNLVKFIPARRERYPSDARKQLDPLFELLQTHHVLASTEWTTSRHGDPQIHLRRGSAMSSKAKGSTMAFDVSDEDFVIDRIEDVRLPEWRVVEDYHRQWGRDFRPSKAELATAGELIEKYGEPQFGAMIPLLVKRIKAAWPKAKSFNSVIRYVDEAATEYRRAQRRAALQEEEAIAEQDAREQRAKRRHRHAILRDRWLALTEKEREEIREAVLRPRPAILRNSPKLVERLCLERLERRDRTN